MDMMQRAGGRKFLMAIAVIGAAMYLELHSEKGLTPTMAGFLVAMVGTFSAANFATSAKFMASKGKGTDPDGLHEKLDQIHAVVANDYNKETQGAFLQVLGEVGKNLADLKATTAQVGTTVINLNKQLRGQG